MHTYPELANNPGVKQQEPTLPISDEGEEDLKKKKEVSILRLFGFLFLETDIYPKINDYSVQK